MNVRRTDLSIVDRPLHLAYADPPYVGLARRYYADQDTFAGEVDHGELLSRLATYDGWALSCSSRSALELGALAVAQDLRDVRLAVWVRTPAPHASARIVTAWEGLLYSPARSRRDGAAPIHDVLLGVDGRRRPTLPTDVIGAKPPAFCAWLFELLGAAPGDELDDLYPGSGIVSLAWRQWVGEASRPPAAATLWSRAAAGDT